MLQAVVAGTAATVLFYLFLLFVQIQNAEDACEGFGPTGNYEDVRGIGFENSFLNLGGRCTYRMARWSSPASPGGGSRER